MGFEFTKETYSGGIKEITLGQGTRPLPSAAKAAIRSTVSKARCPTNREIAMEIWDMEPEEWRKPL